MFKPNSFLLLLVLSYIAYSSGVISFWDKPTLELTSYLVSCIIMYLLGGGLSTFFVKKSDSIYSINMIPLNKLFYVRVLSNSFLMYEFISFFIKFNSFPVFMDDIEFVRLNFSVNGYIHLIGILSYPLFLIYYYNYLSKKNSKSLKTVIYYGLFLFISGFLMGNRGTIAFLILQSLILRSFFVKVNFFRLLLLMMSGGYVLGAINLFRGWKAYGQGYIDDALSMSGGELSNYVLLPFYLFVKDFGSGFQILNLYMKNLDSFTLGYFTLAYPVYSLLPGDQYSILELQKEVLGIDFHGGLLSTFLGFPYIDFGYGGVIILFVFGFLTTFLYRKVVFGRNKSKYIIVYSYFYSWVFIGFYGYTFFQAYVWFNFFTLFFLLSKFK
jgi:oligosaccharide repeat unit polymerase